MKRLISIALSLALALTCIVAMPVYGADKYDLTDGYTFSVTDGQLEYQQQGWIDFLNHQFQVEYQGAEVSLYQACDVGKENREEDIYNHEV